MKDSSLEKERLKYHCEVPQILRDLSCLCVKQKGKSTSHSDQEALQRLFPKTYGQPYLSFCQGPTAKYFAPLNIGVVLSGGQAPGGHSVIAALFDGLGQLGNQNKLVGFLEGPAGIVNDCFLELTSPLIDAYRNTGGFDLIGSGRTKIETEIQLEAALKTVQKHDLNGLVIIGGDDSNTNAALLAEYFLAKGCKTCVVGVPKTIDGDLKTDEIEIPFGFDTATKTYAEMIGNIARDARSAKKYTHFIKLMGRSASHIALECALRVHPNITLIGEEIAARKMTLPEIIKEMTNQIIARSEAGKDYGVILIPEGLIEFIPLQDHLSELPEGVRTRLEGDLDPHGNIQVSHIETERLLIALIQAELKQRPDFKGNFSPVAHFMGYEGRAGFPSNFDVTYAEALGKTACMLIALGYTGYMSHVHHLTSSVTNWEVGGLPITSLMRIEMRKEQKKPVIAKTLVDLDGNPFKQLKKERAKWLLDDAYLFPGPIQFFGPQSLTESKPMTLELERGAFALSNCP